MGNSKTLTVETDNGPVVVRKLALGDYGDLLKAFKKLPAEIASFVEGKSEDELRDKSTIITALPGLVADSIPEFCAVLATATDKDAEFFLKEADLADGAEVLDAILELNDYNRIFNSVKKLMSRGQAQDHKPPTNPAKA